MSITNDIAQALLDGNPDEVGSLTRKALDENIDVSIILNEGLIGGMDVVGKKFREGEVFLPEVISSADAMKKGISILKPVMAKSNAKPMGTFLIGTVEADVHDIGKNLVAAMFEGAGFTVYDIGVDNAPEKFVEAYEKYNPDIVGLSALLSTTMPAMMHTIEAFTEAGHRDKVKIIVGGAPINQDFADKIGADGYAGDAVAAVELGKSLQ